MIQRIQSIYLLLIALLSGGLVFLVKIAGISSGKDIYILDLLQQESYILKCIGIDFCLVAGFALFSLFSYKNRKLQINLNRFNILVNLILLGLLVYYLLNLSGETTVSEKGIGGLIPLASIALLIMANRAIHKDEALVKSVDRLR